MKKHVTPEFHVIRQNEANAKFFVASGTMDFTSSTPSDSSAPAVTQYETARDEEGNEITF